MSVDLHLHTTASDGTLSPAEVVGKAVEFGLTAIAITDHDSVFGLGEAVQAAQGSDLTIISGIELSSEQANKDIHILGYFVDHAQPGLLETLKQLRTARFDRAKGMVERLNSLGLEVDWDEVEKCAGGGAIGRPHIAQVMVRHNLAGGIGEVFERYIGRNGPAYVKKHVLDIPDIINLIHSAGGAASVAHPGLSGVSGDHLSRLKDIGLDAVEVWHTDHTAGETAFYREAATKLGLLMTGGSDCHGFGKSRGFVLGTLPVPDEVIEPLRQAAAGRKTKT